ncbi:hypothetical protein [Celerinatantimonas sp. YJH-8]|uniref:hypothetical protein n=1 Tax=Celerinatantimonas sp. YJH-8 TaxID=3228714 RepID=UPI0038C8DAA4
MPDPIIKEVTPGALKNNFYPTIYSEVKRIYDETPEGEILNVMAIIGDAHDKPLDYLTRPTLNVAEADSKIALENIFQIYAYDEDDKQWEIKKEDVFKQYSAQESISVTGWELPSYGLLLQILEKYLAIKKILQEHPNNKSKICSLLKEIDACLLQNYKYNHKNNDVTPQMKKSLEILLGNIRSYIARETPNKLLKVFRQPKEPHEIDKICEPIYQYALDTRIWLNTAIAKHLVELVMTHIKKNIHRKVNLHLISIGRDHMVVKPKIQDCLKQLLSQEQEGSWAIIYDLCRPGEGRDIQLTERLERSKDHDVSL